MFTALTHHLAALRRRYAEPHRAHHTQAHIDALLAALPNQPLHDPAAVELAIWYHDAIYDPQRTDNEARSADLLQADLRHLAHPALVAAAATMIRATADHRLPDDLPAALRDDTAIFLDLDMAILGADPDAYDAYAAGIAAEYRPVHGPEKYAAGRASFLRAALARDRLFLTDRHHASLDAQARRNLERELRTY